MSQIGVIASVSGNSQKLMRIVHDEIEKAPNAKEDTKISVQFAHNVLSQEWPVVIICGKALPYFNTSFHS